MLCNQYATHIICQLYHCSMGFLHVIEHIHVFVGKGNMSMDKTMTLKKEWIKPRFHLNVYMCISVSHEDRLEDMKCFHSCIYVFVIRITSRQTWRYEVFPFMHIRIRHPYHIKTGLKIWSVSIHAYTYPSSVSHQDRLEDMKCFHSCIYAIIRITSRQTWRYEVFPFMHIRIRHPYHIKTDLKIWSVSIHAYTYPSSVWIATSTRKDSDRWRIRLLAWAMEELH